MKKMFVLASVMIMLGVSLFALTSCSFGGKISNLVNSKLEEKTTTVSEKFNSISIDTKVADVELVPTDGEVKVVSYDHKKVSYDVKVENGELKIEISDSRRWYERIFNFGYSSKLTVYLPESHYGMLAIDQSTGDVDIPNNFTFDNVDISLSTGDVSLMASVLGNVKIDGSTGDVDVTNVTLGSLEIDISTGDVCISGLTCTSDVKIGVSTGDIDLAGVTCQNMTLNLSTGDTELSSVRCNNLSSKANTGNIEMDNVIASECFNIERTTGKVIFDHCDAGEIYVDTNSGSVKGSLLSEKVFITKTSSGKIDVPETITGGKCKITTSSGDIKIEIKN